MKIIQILLLLILSRSIFGQTYIAGDTIGFYTYYPEIFIQDDTVDLDIDCDNVIDVRLKSDYIPQYMDNWQTLRVELPTGGEVMMMGMISIFSPGDTINFNDQIWGNYSFIAGNGGNGYYGWPFIDLKYVGFRMPSTFDTTYMFLKISTQFVSMHIHQIISECRFNPALHITSTLDTPVKNCSPYPMPFNSSIFFDCGNFSRAVFDNLQGQVVLNSTFFSTISTSSLSPGIYILKLVDNNSNFMVYKIVKE